MTLKSPLLNYCKIHNSRFAREEPFISEVLIFSISFSTYNIWETVLSQPLISSFPVKSRLLCRKRDLPDIKKAGFISLLPTTSRNFAQFVTGDTQAQFRPCTNTQDFTSWTVRMLREMQLQTRTAQCTSEISPLTSYFCVVSPNPSHKRWIGYIGNTGLELFTLR